jgi:monoamine oxidase
MFNEKVTSFEESNGRVIISSESGLNIEADYVIFTGSLGVLKSGDIQFTPELSEDKIQRIDEM